MKKPPTERQTRARRRENCMLGSLSSYDCGEPALCEIAGVRLCAGHRKKLQQIRADARRKERMHHRIGRQSEIQAAA